MWRKSGYFGNFVATQFFDFGGKVAIFGGKAADFERKILATLDFQYITIAEVRGLSIKISFRGVVHSFF